MPETSTRIAEVARKVAEVARGPRILALDPSSKCTGYAIMRGVAAGDLIEFGVLKPNRVKDEPIERIRAMVVDAIDLAIEHLVDAVVIEGTTGKVSARHAGGGAGLSVYGMAVGAMWGAISWAGLRDNDLPVHLVRENLWTMSQRKARRARVICGLYPRYAAAARQDPGLDAADAIGLGRWWFVEQMARHARGGGR